MSPRKPIQYKDAGVNIDEADRAMRLLGKWLCAEDDAELTRAANCVAARRYYEKNKEAICAYKRRKWHARAPEPETT